MRQNLLIFAGILALVLGTLFLLQGFGVIRWPASSMMIDQRVWALRGGVLAALGAILIAGVRLGAIRGRRRTERDRGA